MTGSVICLLICVVACENAAQRTPGVETSLSGTINVIVDPEILPILGPAKALYDEAHPDAHVQFVPKDVAESMHLMMNHEERIAIIARDYSPLEDSANANAPNDTLPRALLARDALVFFVAKEFPYDTMNAEHIRQWLAGSPGVRTSYPKLTEEPSFVVSGGASGSIYGNVVNVVLNKKQPSNARIASLGTHDSVVSAIRKSKRSIGIGYLSQFATDTTVKLLRLSYTARDGSHEWPKPVHVSYLIMGKYPFPVPIYVYLKDKPNQYNLPSGFMQFITRNNAALKTLLMAGIEPGYGKFSLVMSDN